MTMVTSGNAVAVAFIARAGAALSATLMSSPLYFPARHLCRARPRLTGWLSFEGGEQALPVQQLDGVYTKYSGKNTRENAPPTAMTASVRILHGKFGCFCRFCYWSISRSLSDPTATPRASSRASAVAGRMQGSAVSMRLFAPCHIFDIRAIAVPPTASLCCPPVSCRRCPMRRHIRRI